MTLGETFFQPALRWASTRQANRFLDQPGVGDAYHAQADSVSALHADTAYWHGTGRFQYKPLNGSKYGGVDHDRTEDVLDSLLGEGLSPRHDLFHERFALEGHEATVSLTQRRMYARLYGCLFSSSESNPEFLYGSRMFWWSYFFSRMAWEAMKDREFRRKEIRMVAKRNWDRLRGQADVEFQRQRQEIWEKARAWTDTMRRDGKFGRGRVNLHTIMTRCTSDISGNHPLVIGVKPDAFEPVPLWSPVQTYEARSAEPISPDQWSCVEVPYQCREGVRAKIEGAGFNVPVVPLEFGELVCREIPFEDLARPHVY